MNRMYRIIYYLVWPIFNLLYPYRAVGRDRIPQGAALICPNHSSNADPLLVVFAMGLKYGTLAMAKEEIRRIPLVGYLLQKAEIIFVKRGESDISAVRAALKALKGGRKLLLFPEGTRHEEIGEGKNGAAMIAIRAGVPVLPVYVPAKKRLFHKTTVVFGEPYMPFTQERKPVMEDYRKVTAELMNHIANLEAQAR